MEGDIATREKTNENVKKKIKMKLSEKSEEKKWMHWNEKINVFEWMSIISDYSIYFALIL